MFIVSELRLTYKRLVKNLQATAVRRFGFKAQPGGILGSLPVFILNHHLVYLCTVIFI